MYETEDNNKQYSEEKLIKLAKKRLRVKRDLFSHIASYFIVNPFLLFIYFESQGGIKFEAFFWPGIVLAAWGIGLILNIINAIQDLNFKYNSSAVDRELEKIKRKLNK